VEDQIREVAEPCPTEQTDLIAYTVIGVRRTHKIDSGVLSNRERSREPGSFHFAALHRYVGRDWFLTSSAL
jgi:hypothetical protein